MTVSIRSLRRIVHNFYMTSDDLNDDPVMLGPRERRWAQLLDRLPDGLTAVYRWSGWHEPERHAVGHLHHVPTLVACLAGSVRVERPGERRDLTAGEVLVIAPGVWHRHLTPRGGSIAWMQGFMSGCSDVLCWDAEGYQEGAVPIQPSLLLMGRLLAAPTVTAAAELIRQVMHEEMAPRPSSSHPAVALMLKAFWSGLHRGIAAAEVVRASGLHRSRAWQLFSEGYGVSPHRALLEARCSLAQGLVDAGMAPGEAARRAGFSNPAAFARERRRLAALQPPRRPSAQRDRVPARRRS